MTTNIVKFPPREDDIAGMLRNLADEIEAGDYGEVKAAAMMLETNADVEWRGFGEADVMRSIALFAVGQNLLSTNFVEACE